MSNSCIACGSPLGSTTGLCYTCTQNGECLDDHLDTLDESVFDRVERYILVSSIRCAECGDLHGEVTYKGDVRTADDFGIDTEDEWELEMEKEEEWIQENEDEVAKALIRLEDEWPQTVEAIRQHVL